jgi:putative redox protein
MAGVPMTVELRGLGGTLTHGPSGARIETQPPKDNGGTGACFSPTDLVGAALASCALTTMALVAQREGLAFGDARASVEKRMTQAPRKIGELVIVVEMPRDVRPEQRARLEEIARGCPVLRSLHPDVQVPIEFRYAR